MRVSVFGLILAVQALCAAFFLVDILSAYLGWRPLSWQVHELVEIGVALCLLAGLGLTLRLMRSALQRTARAEEALRAATGAFHEVVQGRFNDWGLTPAERDVAMFVVKGLSTADIAELRRTSTGTVKAQTAAVFRKSGVSSRAQLVSLFVEDLLGDGLAS